MHRTRVNYGVLFVLLLSAEFCKAASPQYPQKGATLLRHEAIGRFSTLDQAQYRFRSQRFPRGGALIEATEATRSDEPRHGHFLSFISAFKALHKKSMKVKEQVSDECSANGLKVLQNQNEAKNDVCDAPDDFRKNIKNGVTRQRLTGVNTAKSMQKARKSHQSNQEKPNASYVGNYSIHSRKKIDQNSNGSGGSRHLQSDLVAKMKNTVVLTEANATRTEEGQSQKPKLLNNHSANTNESFFISSGYWNTIDKVFSFGMSSTFINLRISRRLRPMRKAAAQITGLHGLLSKKRIALTETASQRKRLVSNRKLDEEYKIDTAAVLSNVTSYEAVKKNTSGQLRRGVRVRRLARSLGLGRRKLSTSNITLPKVKGTNETKSVPVGGIENCTRLRLRSDEARQRADRVREIDRMINRVQKEVVELQCEKDDLQRRPNPLYNYSSIQESSADTPEKDGGGDRHSNTPYLLNRTSRVFNFPPPDFANDYIDDLVDSGRLTMLNHTFLWQCPSEFGDTDDDTYDEDLADDVVIQAGDVGPSEYRKEAATTEKKSRNNRATSGSWLLRQSIGRGLSLGEKIGEAVELAAYKAVCSSVMSVLARSVSALHGVNVMTHSDIRLYVETAPDLPPLARGALPDGDKYAEEAIRKAIRRSAKKRKRRSKQQGQQGMRYNNDNDEAFLQRDAVIETLISHCQISAPLLKLFPLSWQRALLGNIISLVAALVSDFTDGIQIQILGHQLSLSFTPITESDMMHHSGPTRRRRTKLDEFEAAVQATAQDVSGSLEFLDRWHERALGSGMLRAQIGNLIARVVLTLTDEVLSGAKFDLWSAQIGGPRIVAGLEYRVEDDANV